MNIHVIAGPPGVGKSTNARHLIPRRVPIIDQDLAAYQYKKRGFADYQDIASLTVREQIRAFLVNRSSFALELNLGFQSHYEFLRSIAGFDPKNRLSLLLFYTDTLTLCLDRARLRELNGGHAVAPAIVEEMYEQTFPLFQQHKALFDQVRLINVENTFISEPRQSDVLLPDWILRYGLVTYLQP